MKGGFSMKNCKGILLVLLAGVLLISGCGGNTGSTGSTGSNESNASPASVKKVQFWYSIAGTTGDVIKSMADDYNKTQNQYQVDATYVPAGERLQKLTAALGAGSPPDLFSAGPPDLATLLETKSLASIDELAKNAKIKINRNQFHDFLKGLVVKDGTLWAVPVETSVTGLYYNEDLFKKAGINKAPETWEELVEDALKLTDKSKNQWGILLPTAAEQYTGQSWISFLYQAGGKLLTDDKKKAAFNSPEGMKALQLWVDLINKYKVAPLQQLNNGSVVQNFATGNTGMFISHASWIQSTKDYSFKTLTARQPGDKTHASTIGGWYLVIPSKSANKEGAYEFLSWLNRPENNVKWNMGTGSLPTQQAVVDTKAYQDFIKSNPLVKPFNDSLKNDAIIPPDTGQFSAITVILSKAINDAMYQKSTVKEALDKAAADVDKLLVK